MLTYEAFFTTKPVGQGTGLGLSTTVRIVHQHGGFLNVKSELDHGTTFEIYLPCATVDPAAETKGEPVTPTARAQGELILVVDDEQAVREMVSLTLAEPGYRVLTVANGAEAITVFDQRAAAIRLVLLDTEMPVMDGAATLAAIRARAAGLPVVMMSGDVDLKPVPVELAGAKVATLRKPFQLQELLRRVAAALRPDGQGLHS